MLLLVFCTFQKCVLQAVIDLATCYVNHFWATNMKAIDCTVNHDKGLSIDTWFSEKKTKPLLYLSDAARLQSISINDFEITPRLNPNFITGSHICWVSFNYISLEEENQSCLSTVIYPTENVNKIPNQREASFWQGFLIHTLHDVKIALYKTWKILLRFTLYNEVHFCWFWFLVREDRTYVRPFIV